ncbi:MAG TPA: CoA-acylating methylmalonate-semialdehyde dehydrogenase [Pirellulales bacterium]|jgi:malonate-semialdehyde dehydrogenase (acetylating)/methylmalonate-semialdehyde dehydrogenase|nr:CoA-acylating methylmalonate-semialdehyde dehydrogenase [Pirellulales bacterium]
MDALNFINGQWCHSTTGEWLAITNPATEEPLGRVVLSSVDDVDQAVQTAGRAYDVWRRVPVTERIQYLFRLKQLLEENFEDLARTITLECGKTLAEARGEIRRGIENVETACGMPLMMQGYNNEDIARGVDEHLYRQPLGVVVAITPFNFPLMIPLWFLPYAIASGNCFILKPSEKVPLSAVKLIEILHQTGLPAGVVQLVHGRKATVEALLDHPEVRAVSFVGSSTVAKYVYSRAAASGKRAQCQGGAKNPVVILPDADLEMTTKIVAEGAFGCAGQRCLATSIAVLVGSAQQPFSEAICDAAASRRVGYGLDADVEMGPVVSAESKQRIEQLIELGLGEGAAPRVNGKARRPNGHDRGSFVLPTVLDNVAPSGTLARTEIFGPVLSLLYADTIDEALGVINSSPYGNMACLFTTSGAAARRFRNESVVGNVGINIGVPAPMAFYPFSGWKESFFGDLHAQGRHAVEFYTQTKVVVERWHTAWSRKF